MSEPELHRAHSSDYPSVVGTCPACGWHSLFLGEGGFVTCSRLACPAPEAASDLLSLKASAVRLAVAAVPLAISVPLDAEQLRAAATGWHEQPIILPPPLPPGLSLDQLREVAEHLRRRYSPPSVAMSPARYVVHEAMHALAASLDEVAAG